jgi:hypothetical protein
MFLKIFGILDLIAGVILILLKFNLVSYTIAWIFIIYLILKGLIFIKSIASILDIVSSVFMILAVYGFYNVITWIFVLWLIQKGFFSFFITK